jgi:hypothetical protein
MSELQPGMLAMVYGLVESAEHNGKMVVAVEHVAGDGLHDGFRITGSDPGDWLCEHDSFEHGVGVFDRANLLPIRPEADPIDVTETQELHA